MAPGSTPLEDIWGTVLVPPSNDVALGSESLVPGDSSKVKLRPGVSCVGAIVLPDILP